MECMIYCCTVTKLPLLQFNPHSLKFNQYIFHTGTTGEFILAFARRNVPVDRVLAVAESKGLQYRILDESPEGLVMEPIYSLTWRDPSEKK